MIASWIHRRTLPAILILFFLLILTGCEEEIDHEYGQNSMESVNGTGALAQMFANAGCTVRTRYALRPELQRNSDVIVWFPDDFSPPSAKQIQWFDNWLAAQGGRTLIYVGRDFDCEPLYWTEVQKRGLSANPTNVATYLQYANNRVLTDMRLMVIPMNLSWFNKTRQASPGPVGKLQGPWSVSVDSTKHEIHLNNDMNGGAWSSGTALLKVQFPNAKKSKPQDFVIEQIVNASAWSPTQSTNTSRRIIVNNGSFLLNYALVNKEHRVITNHLIKHLAGAKNVTFLESGEGGPQIFDSDNYSQHANGWAFFKIQPLGTILFHLALIGIVLCFVRWPIFGRTKEDSTLSYFDFSLHLRAIASLLRISKDSREAKNRIEQYQAMQRELLKRGIVKIGDKK